MKKNHLSATVMLAMMLAIPSSMRAQSILDTLTFKSYAKYIRPNTFGVYLRAKPVTSSPKLTKDGHLDVLEEWDMMPLLSETAEWYQTPKGWVHKSVMNPVSIKPITPAMMNGNNNGKTVDLGYWKTWRVYGPIGPQGLAIAQIMADNYSGLYLGKLIDNVFVFKYFAKMAFEFDKDNPNAFRMKKETVDGAPNNTLSFGKNFSIKQSSDVGEGQVWDFYGLDLSRLNEKIILTLFKDVIEKGETNYLYIGSELLTGEFANYFDI